MLAVFKREFKGYFLNVYGPIYIAVMLIFAGLFTLIFNYMGRSSGFEYTLGYISIALLVLIPVLAMRTIAEERKNQTIQLLYALPLRMFSIVMGKYLALLAVTAIPVGALCLYPLILSLHGTVSFLKAYAALLVFFLLGAALGALCMFLSSLTDSLVVSAVLGVAACLLIYFANLLSAIFPDQPLYSLIAVLVLVLIAAGLLFLLTKNVLFSAILGVVALIPTLVVYFVKPAAYESLFPKLLSGMALFNLLNNMAYGSLPLSTILTYLSFVVFFLFLTVQSMEKKRWN